MDYCASYGGLLVAKGGGVQRMKVQGTGLA